MSALNSHKIKSHSCLSKPRRGGDCNGGGDKDYDANGEYHDSVCGFIMDKPPRDVEVFGCLISLGQNQRGHACPAREKLDEKHVYLCSCSSFHQVFTKKHMRDAKTTMTRLKVYCDAVTTYSKCKGWWKGFHMWLVESGIANIIIVPQFEADGFTINYNTKRGWVITTPEGEKIVFKKDTGKCKVLPFIYMGSQEDLALMQSTFKVETVRVNYEGFTKKYVVKAILDCKA